MSQQAPSPMTPERWSQVKTLLDRALARPAHERDIFLRRACGKDEELYAEVSHLVKAHTSDSELIRKHPETAPVEAQRDPRIGTVVKNRYRIRSRLGSGGVGVVYLAEDLNLMSRLVVVKFLHEQGRSDPAKLVKFLQEAEALARLDHPGIVAAVDADATSDGAHFLVMQYVDGRTLREILEDGPLALPRAASMLRQLGLALEAAHDKGVIHRDLKPENIMLQQLGDRRDIVKLIDFGVARVEASAITSDTAVIGVLGTPNYMAPEHLAGKPVAASDIFSIAVIAFEMLAGKRPFSAKQPFVLRQQQKQGVSRGAIRNLRPQVPGQAENLIRQALSYDPSHRPKNAREFCEAVASSLELGEDQIAEPGRRRWIKTALLVGGGAAVGAGAYFYPRSVPRAGSKVLAQTVGAADPTEQGFIMRDKIDFSAMRNAERTGFDRLDLKAGEQGLFFKRLATEDLTEALRSGWKITLKGRPVIGGMWACADFKALGEPRYDVSCYREPDGRALSLLCTQHVPTFEGPRYELPDQGAHPHLLELVYDPGTKSCELYVDGRRQVAGYKGHRQQQARDPLEAFFFGISVYRSQRAEAELLAVKFEIL